MGKADTNVWVAGGRFTRDPEAGNGGLVLFGIANNGYKEDDVSFVDCKAFGKIGEVILQYCKKGQDVTMIGRIKQERWESDGTTKSKLVYIVNEVTMHGGKNQGSDNGGGYAPKSKQPAEPAPSALPLLDDYEEIPF